MSAAQPQNDHKDQSKTIVAFLIALAILIVAMGFVPPVNIELKRANLAAGLVNFDDSHSGISESVMDTSLLADVPTEVKDELSVKDKENDSIEVAVSETIVRDSSAFQDFSPNRELTIRLVRQLLEESKKRLVRIAFLGDSFIENDILTSDIRNQMQKDYGGSGVGFVPLANPIANYHLSAEHKFSGWTCYNILQKKKVPAKYQNDFFVSGYLAVPKAGASASFRIRDYSGHVNEAKTATILFKSRGQTQMDVQVNQGEMQHYEPAQSDKVQSIRIACNENIHTLTMSLPQCDDFVGYGVVFESETGVSVQNYGLRSSSGLNQLVTNMNVNRQIDSMMQFDMVVLEYGLNVMSKTATRFTSFGNQMEKVSNYMNICFPHAAVMILSVGDVGMKQGETIATAPAVPYMVQTQQDVAENQHIMFWNTFKAMGGKNSITRFVSSGLAGKDYTHINRRGGAALAALWVNTLNEKRAAVERVIEQQHQLKELQKAQTQKTDLSVQPAMPKKHISKKKYKSKKKK